MLYSFSSRTSLLSFTACQHSLYSGRPPRLIRTTDVSDSTTFLTIKTVAAELIFPSLRFSSSFWDSFYTYSNYLGAKTDRAIVFVKTFDNALSAIYFILLSRLLFVQYYYHCYCLYVYTKRTYVIAPRNRCETFLTQREFVKIKRIHCCGH